MQRSILSLVLPGILLAALAFADTQADNLGAVQPKILQEAQQVIDSRCTVCHTRQRIDIALEEHRDMRQIEQRMLEKGAVLSEKDRGVLGIFWGSPLKSSPPAPRNQ